MTQERTFLNLFPSEIFAEIVLSLDAYSLRSLLVAWPSLLRLFVLITDKPKAPFVFGGIGLSQYSLHSFEPYRCGRPLIKLYELFLAESRDALTDTSDQTVKAPFAKYIDRFSYVHMYNSESICQRLKTGLSMYKTKAHFHEEITPNVHRSAFKASCEKKIPNRAYQQISNSYSFENVKKIENLEFRNLQELTIHFPNSDERPILRDVKAPKLRTLKIFYTHHFPLISNLEIGELVTAEERSLPRSGLEIVDTLALDSGVRYPLPQCNSDIENMSECDLSFSKNFHKITIIGGHDRILTSLDLSIVQTLYWKQASLQNLRNSAVALIAPLLEDFGFESILEKTTVPTLLAENLRTVSLLPRSRILNLNFLLDCRKLDSLLIQSYGSAYGVAPQISAGDVWQKGMIGSISIMGCSLDPTINRTALLNDNALVVKKWEIVDTEESARKRRTRWSVPRGGYKYLV